MDQGQETNQGQEMNQAQGPPAINLAPSPRRFRWRPFKKPSKVYIIEFFLMHLALLGIFISGIFLFNELLDQTKNLSDTVSFYDYMGIEYTLTFVSMGLVATLLFVWLYPRLGRSEILHPELRQSRRRRWLQYGFLVITGLTMIGYVVALTYSVLITIFGESLDNGGEAFWRVALKQLFALAIVGAVSYLVAEQVDSRKGDSNAS